MKKIVSTLKEFTLDLLKNSWFKIVVFILLGWILYTVLGFADVHLDEVKRLEAELKAGEVSYEQAQFYISALHEQIEYQLVLAIIVSMVMVAGMLMEQNSKLRERVKRVDFRLWKLDRNVEEIYELQRLSYSNTKYSDDDENDYVINEIVNEENREAALQELERLQEEQRKLIKEVQELEKKYLSKM